MFDDFRNCVKLIENTVCGIALANGIIQKKLCRENYALTVERGIVGFIGLKFNQHQRIRPNI